MRLFALLFTWFLALGLGANSLPPCDAGDFELKRKLRVSAGVFEAGTNILIQTLFNYQLYPPGCHDFPTWDGNDDQGDPYTGPPTEIKVIASGIYWEWVGGIGNNSRAEPGHKKRSGLGMHANYQMYRDACLIGDKLYVTAGFAEANNVVSVIDINDPFRRVEIQPQLAWMPGCDRIATDGEYIYMQGGQAFDYRERGGFDSFITAAKPNYLGSFDKFLPYDGTSHYGIYEWPAGDVEFRSEKIASSGVDPQTSGRLIATARQDQDQLNILDKVTGELLFSYSVAGAEMPVFDNAGGIYYVSDNELYYSDIDPNGVMSNAALVASADDILAVALDPTTSTVVIGDRTFSQGDYIKAYSTSDYSLSWEFGRKESYTSSSIVYDDKLMFVSAVPDRGERTFIVFTATGGMIVGDQGNHRIQFYDAARNLIHSVTYQPNNYYARIDEGNTSRVFSEEHEFEVDWDLAPMPGNENGMWRLAKNWAMQLSLLPLVDDDDRRVEHLVGFATLSNGRSYFLKRDEATREQEFIEVLGSTLRPTGVLVQGNALRVVSFSADGIVRWSQLATVGSDEVETMYEVSITGFDGSNNPILGPVVTHSSFVHVPILDPKNGGPRPAIHSTLPDGSRVVFQGHKLSRSNTVDDWNDPNTGDFHLGVIERSATGLRSRFLPSVIQLPGAPFPRDGTFDARLSVRNAAGGPYVAGGQIVVVYYGEFWEAGQTNQYISFHESGLMVAAFGVDFLSTNKKWRPEGHAGNAFSGSMVEIGDKVVLTYCDEQHHAMMGLYVCHNTNDIQIFTTPTL